MSKELRFHEGFFSCPGSFSQKHVFLSFMIRFPSTRLGRLARAKTRQEAMEHCNIYYDKLVPEYFFDRNPENFSSILGE